MRMPQNLPSREPCPQETENWNFRRRIYDFVESCLGCISVSWKRLPGICPTVMSKKEGADFHLNQCSDVSIPDGKVFLQSTAHKNCWRWDALLHLCKPNGREGGSVKENISIFPC